MSSLQMAGGAKIGPNWSEFKEDEKMIEITHNAALQIRKMVAKRARGETGLRLGVKSGGCSGFEYTFGWETALRPGDSVFEGAGGARLFVDSRSLRLLDGTVLDYDTSLLSKGFIANNPHATGTCGCGISFSADTPASGQSEPAAEDA
jgi:iron-sulfur cluster assembly protein